MAAAATLWADVALLMLHRCRGEVTAALQCEWVPTQYGRGAAGGPANAP